MSVEGKQSEICLIDTFLQSRVYVSITASVPVEMMFSLKSGSICELLKKIKNKSLSIFTLLIFCIQHVDWCFHLLIQALQKLLCSA